MRIIIIIILTLLFWITTFSQTYEYFDANVNAAYNPCRFKYPDQGYSYALAGPHDIGRKDGSYDNSAPSNEDTYRYIIEFDLSGLEDNITVAQANLIITASGYSNGDKKLVIRKYGSDPYSQTLQQMWDAADDGASYFNDIKYSDASGEE